MPIPSPSTSSRPVPALTAYDTSGVDPSADLTLSGNVTWAGGWGINVGAGGKAQATTSASTKIHDSDRGHRRVLGRGLGGARAGGGRQVLHGQLFGRRHHAQFHAGSDQPGLRLHACAAPDPDLNGMPQLQTPTAAMAAAGLLAACGAHLRSGQRPPDLRQRRRATGCRIRRRAARSPTGTTPLRWCSATKCRATAHGRGSSSSSPSTTAP